MNEVTSNTPNIRKLDLSKLRVEVNSKQFYTSKLKNKDLQNGYRTLIEKNVGQITVYNYDFGVYDKIPPRSTRRQQEQVEKDDVDLETTQDTPPVGL